MIKGKFLLLLIVIKVFTFLSISLSYAQGLNIGYGATLNINNGTLNVPNDIAIDGTLMASTGIITVGGSWTNYGLFIPGTGTVYFIDGLSPVNILGNSEFYNLSATTFTGKQLNFGAGDTQTVTNALYLQGISGNLLVLRSTFAAQQAMINLLSWGTQTIGYVEVKDHSAIGQHLAFGPPSAFNSVDSGNNARWFQNYAPPEVCDGIDNDGDSLIDEDFPVGNTSCGSNVEVTSDSMTFTFSSVTFSGNTTVTTYGTGQPPPSGFKIGTPATYYEISTTVTFTDSVKVCINYDENQFATERSLKLFHWEGSVWKNITTSLDIVANIICGETTSFSPFITSFSPFITSFSPFITSFSPFIIAEELSTAVTLQNFSARLDGNQVILSWSTSFEVDNEGFIILRAESPNGPFIPITQRMIPAVGGSGKATYTFTDNNVEQGKTYYYQMQDIDSRGRVTAYQVIPVTIAVAKTNEILQETTGKDDAATTASQQTRVSGNKKTEGDEYEQTDKPGTWVSVVMQDSASKSSVSETDASGAPVEDATLAKEYYPGSSPQDAGRLIQDAELDGQSLTNTTLHDQRSDMETHYLSYGTSSFSVSIEDDKGNIILVSRGEDAQSTPALNSDLEIKEESGRIVLSWQGKGKARGFVLHRTEKGKDDYTPISNLIPYFGQDGTEQYLYKFIDKAARPGIQYDYRLEVVKQIKEDDL